MPSHHTPIHNYHTSISPHCKDGIGTDPVYIFGGGLVLLMLIIALLGKGKEGMSLHVNLNNPSIWHCIQMVAAGAVGFVLVIVTQQPKMRSRQKHVTAACFRWCISHSWREPSELLPNVCMVPPNRKCINDFDPPSNQEVCLMVHWLTVVTSVFFGGVIRC